MDDYIQISKLNDFIFCPKSIYYHAVYEDYDQKMFHRQAQTVGSIVHENIDDHCYSTSKKYLQGLEVYCEKYKLMGKIDIFDKEEGILIERKFKVSEIYDGYLYQLYAQAFCLGEMGYQVNKLLIHSLSDNKRYEIALPEGEELGKFEKLINDIRTYDFNNIIETNLNKCNNCIYSELCL